MLYSLFIHDNSEATKSTKPQNNYELEIQLTDDKSNVHYGDNTRQKKKKKKKYSKRNVFCVVNANDNLKQLDSNHLGVIGLQSAKRGFIGW